MKNLSIIRLTQALVVSAFALVLTPGCETLNNVTDYVSENETIAKPVVQYATLKVINNDSSRALEVKARVSSLRTITDNLTEAVPVHFLADKLRDEIDFDSLAAEDQILVNSLIDETQRRIQNEIQVDTLDPESIVVVNTALDWVDEAADFYLQGVSEEEVLGGFSPAADSESTSLFEFITGARDWEALVAWWNTPATIEEVERALDAQEKTGGVSREYQAWVDKHNY